MDSTEKSSEGNTVWTAFCEFELHAPIILPSKGTLPLHRAFQTGNYIGFSYKTRDWNIFNLFPLFKSFVSSRILIEVYFSTGLNSAYTGTRPCLHLSTQPSTNQPYIHPDAHPKVTSGSTSEKYDSPWQFWRKNKGFILIPTYSDFNQPIFGEAGNENLSNSLWVEEGQRYKIALL